ncbi:MAG: hypothetical protein ACYCVP_05330, partial [Thermoplasmataceae archaeon]
SLSSSTTTITANLVNGTYSYNIATTDKIYHANGGSFTESAGSPPSENITFALYTYSVTFIESGLPTNTEWYVNITNVSTGYICHETANSNNISIELTNGSYKCSVAVNGNEYVGITNQNNFSVHGGNLTLSVTFFKPNGKIGSNNLWIYILIIGIIIALIIFILLKRKRILIFASN